MFLLFLHRIRSVELGRGEFFFFSTICILVQSISHPLNRLAPFIHNAWNSPQVLAAVSQVAGVDLIPVFEYDTGHCNVSVRPDGDTSTPPPSSPPPRGTEAEKDEKEVFGWHEDCFPFVCVVMLSDCSEMVGGETMLKTGNGELLKVRGPSKVCSVFPSFWPLHYRTAKDYLTSRNLLPCNPAA